MDMARIRAAAVAYYIGSTEEQKQAAQRFFRAMDADNNGNVSIDEFMTFLTSAGFQSEKFYWLFVELDKDNNGTLDFEELLTLFYILSRDEYRDLLNARANAIVPRRRREARPAGQNLANVVGLLNALQGVYQIGQTLLQVGCSIM